MFGVRTWPGNVVILSAVINKLLKDWTGLAYVALVGVQAAVRTLRERETINQHRLIRTLHSWFNWLS